MPMFLWMDKNSLGCGSEPGPGGDPRPTRLSTLPDVAQRNLCLCAKQILLPVVGFIVVATLTEYFSYFKPFISGSSIHMHFKQGAHFLVVCYKHVSWEIWVHLTQNVTPV